MYENKAKLIIQCMETQKLSEGIMHTTRQLMGTTSNKHSDAYQHIQLCRN